MSSARISKAHARRRAPALVARLALTALLSASVAACRGDETPREPTLQDLSSLEQIKTRFNADAGKPRVVLLLSPT